MHYAGVAETLPNGDRLECGQRGEVVGLPTLEPHKSAGGVSVHFDGNALPYDCLLGELSATVSTSLTVALMARRLPSYIGC